MTKKVIQASKNIRYRIEKYDNFQDELQDSIGERKTCQMINIYIPIRI